MEKIKKIIKGSNLLLVFLLLGACTNNNVYFKYEAVDPAGWEKDSVYSFDIEIADTLSAYNIYINTRHTPTYPYQNIWLFISETSPDSIVINDTIEFYLANNRGEWLGSGSGSLKEMPVLFEQNKSFDRSGIYQYNIRHGMRTDSLKGINDIGVRIEKIVQ